MSSRCLDTEQASMHAELPCLGSVSDEYRLGRSEKLSHARHALYFALDADLSAISASPPRSSASHLGWGRTESGNLVFPLLAGPAGQGIVITACQPVRPGRMMTRRAGR